jgi:hypothetical protein
VPAEATAVEQRDGYYVRLSDGTAVAGRAVVIATGGRYCNLDVPRLEEFEGASVYHAATEAEAHLCRGDPWRSFELLGLGWSNAWCCSTSSPSRAHARLQNGAPRIVAGNDCARKESKAS